MYEPPKPGPFTGDTKNAYVSAFLDTMKRLNQFNTGLQIVSFMVKAGAPPWLAEQTLANLTKAINHVPARARHGTRLQVIEGDKRDS